LPKGGKTVNGDVTVKVCQAAENPPEH